MKKVSILFLFLLLGLSVQAGQVISFSVQIIPDLPLGHGGAKSPDETPTVYIEDYTLFFEC